jgi:hypothetical protein
MTSKVKRNLTLEHDPRAKKREGLSRAVLPDGNWLLGSLRLSRDGYMSN